MSSLKQWSLGLLFVTAILGTATGAKILVEPKVGQDIQGNGTLAAPYKTLSHAYYSSDTKDGDVIMLLPGVYGKNQGQSGDYFPLFITSKEVVIQGTNALNTILDGDGCDRIFWFAPGEINVHLENFLVDSVTMMNAQEAIYCGAEGPTVWSTFANCFIVNNGYGVHMNAIWDESSSYIDNDWDTNNYVEQRFRLVNCTIANNGIGILDDSVILDDPDGTVNGEAAPAVVNCMVYPNSLSDLEGVDGSDLRNTAFATSDMAGLSQILPTKPLPVSIINVNGFPPTALYLYPHNPNGTSSNDVDYRQYPSSPTINAGTTDLTVLANQTLPRQLFSGNPNLIVNIWDLDCEGHGNPYPDFAVDPMDIGADQLGDLILTGFNPQTTDFGANSTVHLRVTRPVSAGAFSAIYLYGNADASAAWVYQHGYIDRVWPTKPLAQPRWTTHFPTANHGIFYLNGYGSVFPIYMPVQGTAPVYTPIAISALQVAAPVRWNLQSLPLDSGAPVGPLSNAQTICFVP